MKNMQNMLQHIFFFSIISQVFSIIIESEQLISDYLWT